MSRVTDLKTLHAVFAELFNKGDAAGLASLYEAEAVFTPQPGTVLRGIEAIRPAIEAFVNTGFKMTLTTVYLIENGDLGLLSGAWQLKNGQETAMSGKTSEVVRRGADGSWRYLIDNPFSA